MSPTFVVLCFAIVASAAAFSEITDHLVPDRQPYENIHGTSSCGPNGRDSGCASRCEPKCSTRAIQAHLYCTEECVEGCICDKGYILEDITKQCVKPEKCKKPNEYKKKKTVKETTPSCTGYCI